ncbi:hypothetical protein BDW22DRAFT_374297 [Trametopsis cervina]|nr:hypothetical protein BDW22DRAFT_374297 [Trametopsis cervina]
MSIIVEPVTYDNIYFYAGHGEDGFYVEVPMNSERNVRHRRAKPSHLYALLTRTSNPPIATPADVLIDPPPAPKEEPAHFYCAQLLHYGLKPLKTKPAAKKALLKAFGIGQTLAVPQHIIQIREQLEAEYTIANETARQQREEQERQRREQAEAREKAAEEIEEDIRNAEKEQLEEARRLFDEIMAEGPATELYSRATLGCFNLYAPSVNERWPRRCKLGLNVQMMPPEESGGYLYLCFDFGAVLAFACASWPPTSISRSCTFTWRGEEGIQGKLLNDSENKGTITFLGNGMIIGMIEGEFLDKTQFVGIRDERWKNSPAWQNTFQEWKDGYREFISSTSASASGNAGTTGDRISCESESEEDSEFGHSDSDHRQEYPHLREETGQPIIPQKRGHGSKQIARRRRPFISGSDALQTSSRTQQTAIRESGIRAASKDTAEGASASAQLKSTAKLGDHDTCGQFDIDCPSLRPKRDKWHMHTYPLQMSPSKNNSHIWAAFNFGTVSGVMRCTAPPVEAGHNHILRRRRDRRHN